MDDYLDMLIEQKSKGEEQLEHDLRDEIQQHMDGWLDYDSLSDDAKTIMTDWECYQLDLQRWECYRFMRPEYYNTTTEEVSE